jgi:2-dehydropantoate 2-reductase
VIERVCVVGAGVIGSLFAGHLAAVCDVSVLTRRKEHADALNREGLRVTGKADRHARVQAATDPAELDPPDVAIVATKATGLREAMETLDGHFPGATMTTVLNGLGAEEIVREHGAWPIVSGVTFMSGTRHTDTHVEYILDTET